jgi:predicted glycosyltransferase
MSGYLLFSHDGFGLGHVRRNLLIARSILAAEPSADVTLVTGVATRPPWLDDPRIRVVEVPPLLKNVGSGDYRCESMHTTEAIAVRQRQFRGLVERLDPQVIVVDRHPYGTAGELRAGLELARDNGAVNVLGLRDVLDAPEVVATEMRGAGWADVTDVFDEVLVYGSPTFVDHEAEYGLPVTPVYCGWVVESVESTRSEPGLLAVAAGGGGDGGEVFALAAELVRRAPAWRAVVAAGCYTDEAALSDTRRLSAHRMAVEHNLDGCVDLFARAAAVLCMAGYNSTVEALAAGQRPILFPRRSPRREQAIRAGRLASLGLADVVDAGAPASEVHWLLNQSRRTGPSRLKAAGIRLDGADVAARQLLRLAQPRVAA